MRFLLFALMLPLMALSALVGAAFVPLAALLAPVFPGLSVLRRTSGQWVVQAMWLEFKAIGQEMLNSALKIMFPLALPRAFVSRHGGHVPHRR